MYQQDRRGHPFVTRSHPLKAHSDHRPHQLLAKSPRLDNLQLYAPLYFGCTNWQTLYRHTSCFCKSSCTYILHRSFQIVRLMKKLLAVAKFSSVSVKGPSLVCTSHSALTNLANAGPPMLSYQYLDTALYLLSRRPCRL